MSVSPLLYFTFRRRRLFDLPVSGEYTVILYHFLLRRVISDLFQRTDSADGSETTPVILVTQFVHRIAMTILDPSLKIKQKVRLENEFPGRRDLPNIQRYLRSGFAIAI